MAISALGVDGRPFETPPGTPTKGDGAAKNWELLKLPWVLRPLASRSRFPFCVARPKGFRLYAVYRGGFVFHFRVGCWVLMAKTKEDGRRRRNPKGRARNAHAKFRIIYKYTEGPAIAPGVFRPCLSVNTPRFPKIRQSP